MGKTGQFGGLRVGAVDYLNSRPLVYRLQERCPGMELLFDLPSRLADRLHGGDLSVALIPSVESFRDPRFEVISDACIACRGPVWSVKLICRVPPEKIGLLALDEGSRTSAVLVRILLAERFGIRPQVEPLPLGRRLEESAADAVLLIGDRAIHSPPGRFAAVWDLGDEWHRWTGLPFVFAMWVAQPGLGRDGLAEVLSAARDEGVREIARIAEKEAPELGLTRHQCEEYLRRYLHFVLGPEERAGLNRFRELAERLDLLQPNDPARRASAQPVRRRIDSLGAASA